MYSSGPKDRCVYTKEIKILGVTTGPRTDLTFKMSKTNAI